MKNIGSQSAIEGNFNFTVIKTNQYLHHLLFSIIWSIVVDLLLLWQNTMTKNNFDKEGFIQLATPSSLSITERTQNRKSNWTGTWRQELKKSLWRSTVYWLASPDILCLLSYNIQDHKTSDRTTLSQLGTPTSIINQKNVPQVCL